jgi:hypothetical protein
MMEETTPQTKPKRKTKTSTAVKRRYMNKVYTRIYADLPKELVASFKAATREHGTTTADVFRKTMERFIAEYPPHASDSRS